MNCIKLINGFILFILIIVLTSCTYSSNNFAFFRNNYNKQEVNIIMRDGVKLFTSIYSPKDQSEKHPIIIWRTPYSCTPYGEDKFAEKRVSSFFHFIQENYIIIFQDVRGKFMSEGEYVNMRPYIPNKVSNKITDESTDAYDTIEWLINNVENNNGKVGVWGISYPGFYAAMATIDAHPALKAVSPQAPIADWFIGDDMHHNGAFTLLLNFNFFKIFGLPRNELIKEWKTGIEYPSPDAYNFFLELGSLKNVNKFFFKNNIAFWDSSIAHPNYDYFWQSRNTLPHFKDISPAVMTVGGWYDGEDLWGSLKTYESIETNNPDAENTIVIGPWPHGGWARSEGNDFGDMNFESNTADYYKKNIELPFFNQYLKNAKTGSLPEAFIFNTGKNEWHKFDQYPPDNLSKLNLYFNSSGLLTFNPLSNNSAKFAEYISDPNKPVPYTAKIIDSKKFYNKTYLVEDQRFASSRPDVLVYESEELKEELTITGLIEAELYVSTSGTDSDWIVKIIDVYPDDEPNPIPNPNEIEMGGYQMLVRAEIMRGKFRNSFEKPEPMIANNITKINIDLNDVCHTFLKGHKIMVQIQSSWFPLFDRNPQKFVDIYDAAKEDFQITIQRIYHSTEYTSKIKINKLN